MKRKPALDVLRIIATVLIVFHHYNQVMGDAPGSVFSFYNNKFYFGYMVELFFILSGYLSIGYQEKIEKGLSYGSFIGKKALRFMPLVVISSVAYYAIHVLYVVVNKESWLGVFPYVTDIVKNSLGLQAGWFFNANYCNYPLWYISVLLLCYSFYYLLTWLGHKTKLPKELFYSVIMLIGAAIMILYGAGLISMYIPFVNTYAARGYLCFFMGILIALIQAKKNAKNYIWFWGSSAVFLLIVMVSARGMIEYFSLVLGFALLIFLFSSDRINSLISWRGISIIGESTFYVYALHLPVLMLFVVLRDLFLPDLDIRSNIFMLAFTSIMFFLAFVILVIKKRFRCRKKSNHQGKDIALKGKGIEELICRISPKHYWIVSFLLGSVAMFVMLSYSQMLSTGKYVLLAGDSLHIYASNIRMLLNNIMNGETIWYSFSSSLGLNTSLSVAFDLMSPFNILFLVFYNTDVNKVAAVIVILKTGLAAATFQLFASKVLKVRGIKSIIFAVFYAMCSFAAIYGVINFMWLDGLYMLPLVALATYKAVHEKKFSLLTFSYAYIFIVQFYQGYMIGIFSFLFFALLLFTMKKEERLASVGGYFLRYVLTFVSSVLIAAFLWVPVVCFLKEFYASDSTAFEPIEITVMQVFNNLFWGESQDYYYAPYVYCGLPCLLLLPCFFVNRSIEPRKKAVWGILLLFFVIGCIFLPLFKVLHAFDAPDMWNYRFSFIISFILCVIACKESEYIGKINKGVIAPYLCFLAVFYLLEGYLEKVEIGAKSHNSTLFFLVNAVWIGGWIVLSILYEKTEIRKKELAVALLFMALAECITNGCAKLCSDEWKNALTLENYYYTWAEEMEDVSEKLKSQSSDDFYRVMVLNDMNKNSDSFWGFNGIAEFGTAENQRVRDFLNGMGLYSYVRRMSPNGMTPPLEMLLAVKYRVRLYTETQMAGLEAPPKITETENCLPLGFMVEDGVLKTIEMGDNSFENQNEVFEALTGIGNLYTSVPENRITLRTNGMRVVTVGDGAPVLVKDEEGANMVLGVNGTSNPVYMQIAYSEPPEEIVGVYYDTVENMSYTEDNSAWIPFAAKMWQSGGFNQLSLYTLDGLPVCFETEGIYIYELNKDKLDEIQKKLGEESLEITEYKNGSVKGNLTVSGNKKVLFTSIPYSDGWRITLNGEKAEVIPVLNNTFMGIIIPNPGEYSIDMKYRCPGALAGFVMAIFGVVLFAIQIIGENYAGRKGRSKE